MVNDQSQIVCNNILVSIGTLKPKFSEIFSMTSALSIEDRRINASPPLFIVCFVWT